MYQFWWGFWWLIFPIGFFVYRAWDRWLSYQRSRHALEVMKQYAAQGKGSATRTRAADAGRRL